MECADRCVALRIGLRWRCTDFAAWASVQEMTLNHVRRGSGRPLLLVHGLGAGWRSWSPIIDELAESREVIAVDLPGFGESPPLTGEVSIATLTDSVAEFIREQGLDGVSTVGQSMGGRMVLELARRGVGGDSVALDPGGFWSDRELAVFGATLRPSIALVRGSREARCQHCWATRWEGRCCWRSCRRGPGHSRARPCCRMCADWRSRRRPARPWTP